MTKLIKHLLRSKINAARCAGKQKIFCIGRNKTGTTSLAKALKDLGVIVAEQRPAELLIHDWSKRDFRRIFRFCHTAQAFQDIPFSLPYTFQALDLRFPGSKFILSMRKSPEQWYNSLINFHAKKFGCGRVPSYDNLKNANYIYRSWMLEVNRAVYQTPDDDLYNREILINHYNFHNQSVMEYFRHRSDDLLVINMAENSDYAKFCEFIGKPFTRGEFPWENRTDKIEVP